MSGRGRPRAAIYSSSGMENHPVGKKQPNELYIYDMTGNVCEWCNDWYDENYYKNSPSSNPRGAILGSTRVFRGGCAYNPSRYCRVSKRYNTSPIYSTETNGFRVAFTPQ